MWTIDLAALRSAGGGCASLVYRNFVDALMLSKTLLLSEADPLWVYLGLMCTT
jgi:hypothetical protein